MPIPDYYIREGEIHKLKEVMKESTNLGMRTFDWALFDLYGENHISYEEAIRNSDSANELRLNIKLKSPRGEPASATTSTLSLDKPPAPAEAKA